MNPNLLVAAIDFGTTFSGYAFSFQDEFRRDPFKIFTNNWIGGGYISHKAPTTVLFDPQKVFQKFGYEAEDKYAELAESDNHKDWYYFRRFKMLLHDHKTLSRTTILNDEHNKQLPAMLVFSSAIRYLKGHLLTAIGNKAKGFKEDDILWILTVPAIWNESAKQFMREAAVQAGIDTQRVRLALEPEAASVYCKALPIDRVLTSGSSLAESFRSGSTYMTLDLGGGTVDITVHTVHSDGSLSEVTKASGGAWGGIQVDAAYLAFLEDLVDQKVLRTFKENAMSDFLEIMREFEVKKRTISDESDGVIKMRIPASLDAIVGSELHSSLQEKVNSSSFNGQVGLKMDKLLIDADIFKRFFNDTISKILYHVDEQLDKTDFQNIDAVLLAGGFAESKIVQSRIKKKFAPKTVIIPEESELIVLKGAVMYGHFPGVFKSRISKYSYGIEMSSFATRHVKTGKYLYEDDFGVVRCKHIFDPYVLSGETIPVNSEVKKTYKSSVEDVTEGFGIYASTNENPVYVNDPDCFLLGKIYLEEPGRVIAVKMQFGGTEFSIQCKDVQTGVEKNVCYDFLCH